MGAGDGKDLDLAHWSRHGYASQSPERSFTLHQEGDGTRRVWFPSLLPAMAVTNISGVPQPRGGGRKKEEGRRTRSSEATWPQLFQSDLVWGHLLSFLCSSATAPYARWGFSTESRLRCLPGSPQSPCPTLFSWELPSFREKWQESQTL